MPFKLPTNPQRRIKGRRYEGFGWRNEMEVWWRKKIRILQHLTDGQSECGRARP
jgi:hypothetical protein